MKRLIGRARLGLVWMGLGFFSTRETLRLHVLSKKRRAIPLDHSRQFAFPLISRLLIASHVRQFNASSCSAASAVTVINTLKTYLNPDDEQPKISQAELLDTIRTVPWKERVSPSGHKGQRGMPLDIFGKAMEDCLQMYEIPFREIDVVAFDRKNQNSAAKEKLLYQRLTDMADDLPGVVIAHFDQGAFLPGLHLPHISPVGAFDPATRRILMLDVCPAQKTPYWITVPVFTEALAGDFGGWLRHYGYDGGGYVWIRLR